MFPVWMTWIFSDFGPQLDDEPGAVPKQALIRAAVHESVKDSSRTVLTEDGYVLNLVRVYFYTLALIYACVGYRLRDGLVRLRLGITLRNRNNIV